MEEDFGANRLKSFYPILDTQTCARRFMDPVQVAAALLEAGVGILQFRHKGFFSNEIFRQAHEVAALCRDAGAEFVMNDRADIAALLSAALHLGQDDLTPADARRVVGENTVIGLSTHNEFQLRAALMEPVNYVAFGPVFGTISKINPDPVVGLAELRRSRSLTQLPIVAIGGITRENARSVIEAGADSVAVIGDLYPEDGDIRPRAEEWLLVPGLCPLQTHSGKSLRSRDDRS